MKKFLVLHLTIDITNYSKEFMGVYIGIYFFKQRQIRSSGGFDL